MKQKVSLASVLAGNVSVAFLDEPTLGLDVESSLKLRHELRRLADERGLTPVISSHNMDVIEAVCDRVIIVNEGRIIATTPSRTCSRASRPRATGSPFGASTSRYSTTSASASR